MATNKHRWVFFTNCLDLEIFDIILYSCKFTVFDKKEILLDIPRGGNESVSKFVANKEIESTLTSIIKDKKNKYIIYMLGKSDPVEVRKSFESLAKNASPRSNFLFNLVCKDPQYINHKDFYSIYILDGDSRFTYNKEQEGNNQQ